MSAFDSTTTVAAAANTARRLRSRQATAEHFRVSAATIDNWHGRGYLKAYKIDNTRTLYFDLDEIERAFIQQGSKMRDGRRRGAKGQVVRLVTSVAESGE